MKRPPVLQICRNKSDPELFSVFQGWMSDAWESVGPYVPRGEIVKEYWELHGDDYPTLKDARMIRDHWFPGEKIVHVVRRKKVRA